MQFGPHRTIDADSTSHGGAVDKIIARTAEDDARDLKTAFQLVAKIYEESYREIKLETLRGNLFRLTLVPCQGSWTIEDHSQERKASEFLGMLIGLSPERIPNEFIDAPKEEIAQFKNRDSFITALKGAALRSKNKKLITLVESLTAPIGVNVNQTRLAF